LQEGLAEKFYRGFLGSNPYISFVLLPPMNKKDASETAAALKIFNYCISTNQVHPDLYERFAKEFRQYRQYGEVAILTREYDGKFVPVVSVSNPQVASQYGFTIDPSIKGSGVLVARQSDLADQVDIIIDKSTYRKQDAVSAYDAISKIIPVGCDCSKISLDIK
jgi:hypothetical protein